MGYHTPCFSLDSASGTGMPLISGGVGKGGDDLI
jgi:hypothetical protein